MKKVGLFLLLLLFVTGVHFLTNSTAVVAAEEEPEINWSDEETISESEPSLMDDPEYYDPYDEEESESDESSAEDASDVDQEEGGDEESY
jgi:hypothetical protein